METTSNFNMTQSENTNEPLVSVVVITYNSAKTVVETLDSIKAQTYQNIELIVSDDCSKDNTAEIVIEWLNRNRGRFVYAEWVTSAVNTGVSGNINRGITKSSGEWIKSIAGDDLLVSTAIEEYVHFVVYNKNTIKMCVCDVLPFAIENSLSQTTLKIYQKWFKFAQEEYESQIKRVSMFLVFVGPAYFYSRELYDEVGGFDESYGNLEEWPFVYKVIKKGYRIYTLDRKLVKYRISPTSLCNETKNGLENYGLFNSKYRFFFAYPFRDLISNGRYLIAWDMYLYYKIRKLRFKSNNSIWVRLLQIFTMLFSPYAYYRMLGLGDFRYYN